MRPSLSIEALIDSCRPAMAGSSTPLRRDHLSFESARSDHPRRRRVLGLPCDAYSQREAASLVTTAVENRRACRIVFINAAKVVSARRDLRLTRALEAAEVVGADGQPIVWVSRLLGEPLPSRLNGTDLMMEVLELAHTQKWRVFFLGSRNEVLNEICRHCAAEWPGLEVAGIHHGYFAPDEDAAVAATIAEAKPDVLLVGMPSPRKEYWINDNGKSAGTPVVLAVGGSLEVLAGRVRRAPGTWQRTGLEWLWRMMQEPRRLGPRYLMTNTIFLCLVAGAWIRRQATARRLSQSDLDAAELGNEIETRAERLGWASPDPYDGLWWRWPPLLVGGRRRRQAIMQLHARSPIDPRRFRRAAPPLIAKTLALFGSAALAHHELDGSSEHLRRAVRALDRMLQLRSPEGAFGYPFDVQTRWSFYPAATPNAVVTSFAVMTLRRAAPKLGEEYAHAAREAAEWICEALHTEGTRYFAYHPLSRSLIHNANVLAATSVLDVLGHDPSARGLAMEALATTLEAQNPDGSWPYGTESNLQFVDSYHTGYVLWKLADSAVEVPHEALSAGARFYRAHFFRPDGGATLWPDRTHPEDAHSAGTALTTLSALERAGLPDEGLRSRVAARLANALVRDDRVLYRRHRLGAIRTEYLRWATGHVALGLVEHALQERLTLSSSGSAHVSAAS
jgi:N-acetylglucosaminyldiphosphoundecaprenol N-acetyl-beta-D-mannosaminyltransferase